MGYFFDSWTGSGIADASSASTTVRITGDQNISASFTPIIYDLNLSIGLGGSVDGNGSYAYGSDANLLATPDPGYLFSAWTGDLNSSDANVTVTVSGDLEINATFTQDLNDNDDDNLTNYDELVTYSSNPDNNDSDGDGLADGVEVSVGLDPTVAHTDLMNLFAARELAARQRGIDEGNASGQALVVANPSAYSLVTEVDKNASDAVAYADGLAEGNSTGKGYVVTNNLLFALYTQSFKDAMDLGAYLQGKLDGEPLGRDYVQNNPHLYELVSLTEQAMALVDENASGIAEGNSSGIDAVKASPTLYGLFTEAEVNASKVVSHGEGVVEGNATAIADVSARPRDYSYFSLEEVEAGLVVLRSTFLAKGSADGVKEVEADPNAFTLFTTEQYDKSGNDAYGSGFSHGEANGTSYTLSNPRSMGLYRESEVKASETVRFDEQYLSGHKKGMDDKLAEIRSNFAKYGLAKAARISDLVQRPYTPGWYYQPEWGWMLSNKDVFPHVYRAGNDQVERGWMEAMQLEDLPAGSFYDSSIQKWFYLGSGK
ncbi:MAG: hypothetical protein CMI30_00140 [Opitutae bacterium]|nr:hypothetical protein [Opitutae bacterium]